MSTDEQPLSLIVYGPRGSGKTANAQAIAKHYGLSEIIDGWRPGDEYPERGALVLSNVDLSSIRFRRTIYIRTALNAIGVKSA